MVNQLKVLVTFELEEKPTRHTEIELTTSVLGLLHHARSEGSLTCDDTDTVVARYDVKAVA